ncbi:carbohydrate ABC transporter permease [Bogoriella caseilytica]|uniref:Carbohydrate ABC transporter membrane protein 1 (CUT1 family) n=1 Tax=Bogoriella caseilytica TaxID=56055 RepID=A0A3N2BFX8_9MICO|nr:sugar ABC transporter permease [Bogoriella caseilytica]ROR74120.1 carbohydrate ABC transporter membrane protein 1 (CUT1 family) [Bogoriella caseilytica]
MTAIARSKRGQPHPAARGATGRRRSSPTGSSWTPWAFLAPGVLYLLIFQGYPLVEELLLSFSSTSLLNPHDREWVGLDNYRDIFASPDFRQTLSVTLVYTVTCVVGAVGSGLGVALLLNAKFRGRGIARALVAIPWAAPTVAVAVIATWMMNAQYGIVNRALEAVGLGVPSGNILDSADYALPAILATTIWQLFPFCSIVLLAALQAVPKEVKEAASMDGAGHLWTFRVATWPVIKPTVGLLTLLMTIWSIRRFELIWIMTKGGPLGSTETLVIDLYSSAFEHNDLGRAAAIGMVGVCISLAVVLIGQSMALRAEKKGGH